MECATLYRSSSVNRFGQAVRRQAGKRTTSVRFRFGSRFSSKCAFFWFVLLLLSCVFFGVFFVGWFCCCCLHWLLTLPFTIYETERYSSRQQTLIAAHLNAEISLVVTATSWALGPRQYFSGDSSVLKTNLMNNLLFLIFVIFNIIIIINVVRLSRTSCGRTAISFSAIWYSCQRRKVFDPDDNQRDRESHSPYCFAFPSTSTRNSSC